MVDNVALVYDFVFCSSNLGIVYASTRREKSDARG